MKKFFLLMAAGIMAAGANAQDVTRSAVRVQGNSVGNMRYEKVNFQNHPRTATANNTANKTTAGGSRWYNYVDLLAALDPAINNNTVLPYMWFKPDMYGIYQGTSGLERDTITFGSFYSVLQPTYEYFNDPTQYPGEIALKTANAYTLDSVSVYGFYGRNPDKPNIVDTLRFTMTYGNGGTSNIPIFLYTGIAANYGVDTLRCASMYHDTLANMGAKSSAGPNVVVRDVYLTALSVNDTISNGLNVYSVAGAVNVPAGNLVGATVTFISGESYVPYSDTVFRGSINPTVPFKFGMFRPLFFEQNDGTFQNYTAGNYNTGGVKFMPTDGNYSATNYPEEYIPSYAFIDGAYNLEFPYMDFKVTCATCDITSVKNVNVINTVGNVVPNPATGEVSMAFTMKEAANVTVNITNTLGQIVKTQNMGKYNANQSGKAQFSVSDLSNGIYFVTLEANGQRVTKRLVVAH